MNEAQIRAAIFDVLAGIAPEADPTALDPGADLRQALDIDSFDFLQLLMRLHERLGIDIPEQDYGRLRTLEQAVSYLSGKLEAGRT